MKLRDYQQLPLRRSQNTRPKSRRHNCHCQTSVKKRLERLTCSPAAAEPETIKNTQPLRQAAARFTALFLPRIDSLFRQDAPLST